jgi:hypothetical protein
MSPAPTNRKAADQLADVRARIKVLEAEEAELREGFIAGTLDPVGDGYTVAIETKINERIDLAEMRQRIAERIWKPYVVEKSVTYVNVRRRKQ